MTTKFLSFLYEPKIQTITTTKLNNLKRGHFRSTLMDRSQLFIFVREKSTY